MKEIAQLNEPHEKDFHIMDAESRADAAYGRRHVAGHLGRFGLSGVSGHLKLIIFRHIP